MARVARRVPPFEALYRAIAALPEGVTGEILEPGFIRAMGRPGSAHRFAAGQVGEVLRRWNRNFGGSGWWIEVEAELRLPGDRLVVPDLAGWRVEDDRTFLHVNPVLRIPDWCCEVLSHESTARDDRRLKLPLCASVGIGHVWLVDPEERLVECYETRDGVPALVASAKEQEAVTLPPFGGEFDVGRFWEPPVSGER